MLSSETKKERVCPHCQKSVEVTGMAPYTLVTCPYCHGMFHSSVAIGSYRIIAKLGEGGMSIVFRARDATLQRDVALKVLNEEYSRDVNRVLRLEKEAQIMARISHPNVVKIYGVGREEDKLFLSMELIEGSNLEAYIHKKGRIAELQALEYAIQIARGLQAGLDEGVLHRDMKPANVLINSEGNVQIVDFGLALLSGESFQEEQIWVTPHYAPPETLLGKEEDVRSDIYALGATLYHALSAVTSITLVSQSIRELVEAKHHVLPLGKKAPFLSLKTCQIMDKCLSFDPQERYADYASLLRDLKEAHTLLKKGESWTWAQEEARQKKERLTRWLVTGGASLVVVLLALLGALTWQQKEEVSPVVEEKPLLSPQEKLSQEESKRQATKELGGLFVKGREAFLEGNYKQSAQFYREMMQRKEAPPLNILLTGIEKYLALYMEGQQEKGQNTLRKTLESLDHETENKALLQMIAPVQLLADGEPIPLEICQKGQEMSSALPFISGLLFWERAQVEEAQACFALLEKFPGLDEAWEQGIFTLAQSYQKDIAYYLEWKKKTPRSSQDWKAMEEAWSSYKPVSGQKAQSLLLEEKALAHKAYIKALEEEKQRALVYESQAFAPEWLQGQKLLKKGEYERALEHFTSAQKQGSPLNVELYSGMKVLSEGAFTYLRDLALYLEIKEGYIPGKKKDGTFIQILKTGSGEPRIRREAGSSLENARWNDLLSEELLLEAPKVRDYFSWYFKDWDAEAFDKNVYAFAFLTGKEDFFIKKCPKMSGEKQRPLHQWEEYKKKARSLGFGRQEEVSEVLPLRENPEKS